MKPRVISGKEVVKILLKNGFEVKRQKGSHVHLDKIITGKIFHVTIPIHGNQDLNPFVLRSIIRQSGLSPEDFSK
ncbi:MAG: type II toxin-antitoxin system HicA family toxin [Candidatus Micrarchaeota archaeon]